MSYKLLFLFEPENYGFMELFAGIEKCRREIGMMGRVGEMLTFYCHTLIVLIWPSFGIEGRFTAKPIGGIHLRTGLGGKDFKLPATLRVAKPCHYCQFARNPVVNHKAMVISFTYL